MLGTMNRTPLSWVIGIDAAEWILRWLPRGTHEWSRFVKPKETASLLKEFGFGELELHGIVFNPFVWRWQASRSTARQLFAKSPTRMLSNRNPPRSANAISLVSRRSLAGR